MRAHALAAIPAMAYVRSRAYAALGLVHALATRGWYPRGGVKARYGQQPLEAAAMVDAAFAALDVTGDERWRSAAETAHEWFFGGNDKRAQVATKTGCRDGLDAAGVNGNMGAESAALLLVNVA
jgi:hypothetical protein